MLASGPWRKWEWMSRTGPPHSDDKGLCARNVELAVTTAAVDKNSLRFIINAFPFRSSISIRPRCRLCHRHRAPLRTIGVVLHFALVVEDHRRALVRRESRPFRQPRMIRVALARERYPGIAHPRGQRASVCAATGHIRAAVNVVENKRQLGAMERARTTVEHRCLPREQNSASPSLSTTRQARCAFRESLPAFRRVLPQKCAG